MSARRHASILRWLGPTAAPTAIPPGIERSEITVAHRAPFRAWVYRREDRAPSGSVLVSPGLHYAGPEDVRFDRFCRVLARSGALVVAPFLPTYLRMDVEPEAIDELESALDALLALPERPRRKPSVFSISFGSMPALRLAGRRGEVLSSVVVFGGFGGFERTLRFALKGDAALGGDREGAAGTRKHDPLNAPVVVQNLMRFVEPPLSDTDRATVRAAFRRYCASTWGRQEMKVHRAFERPARAIAEELDEPLRTFFLKATRCEDGIETIVEDALARSNGAFAWIDPAPHLSRLEVPVTLVHGRDDDVIPFEESIALHRALKATGSDVSLHLTGMFGHTGKASLSDLIGRAGESVAEIRSMVAMLRALGSL